MHGKCCVYCISNIGALCNSLDVRLLTMADKAAYVEKVKAYQRTSTAGIIVNPGLEMRTRWYTRIHTVHDIITYSFD